MEEILSLNESQLKAYDRLNKFLKSDDTQNFLLLGPAGSGKTTVMINAFKNTEYKIAFCAFTNKATQVLSCISQKFDVVIDADFCTIHKLLGLEVKDGETQSLLVNENSLANTKKYDIIVFDECSTISRDLYNSILYMREYNGIDNHSQKYIYLGDFWQLPPVNENSSIVFDCAKLEKWPVAKLSKIMRSNNDTLLSINNSMLECIPALVQKKYAEFCKSFPYNMISIKHQKYISHQDMINKYIELYNSDNSDIVILTYTNTNCKKINLTIQEKINKTHINAKNPKFNSGDRCVVEFPVKTAKIKHIQSKTYDNLYCYTTEYSTYLYNGDIFDIIEAKDCKIQTPFNKFSILPEYFDGQYLVIKNMQTKDRHHILYVFPDQINTSREILKFDTNKFAYKNANKMVRTLFPVLNYGYAITLYKSQGSEYKTVFINLSSIKYSMLKNITSAVSLFKATYTAASRASDNMYIAYID